MIANSPPRLQSPDDIADMMSLRGANYKLLFETRYLVSCIIMKLYKLNNIISLYIYIN